MDNTLIPFDKPSPISTVEADNMNSMNIRGSTSTNEKKETIVNQFKNLQLLYPVGRHIAIKSLDN